MFLKISPLRLVPFSVLLKTNCESVYFLKLHILQLYALLNLKVSWLFNCCDSESNIKNVKNPEKTADIF